MKQLCCATSTIIHNFRLNSFITTPIFYANAAPHVGHLYTSVLSDAHHRWMKLKDPEGKHIFATGTDEHGIKIFRAAEKAGMDAKSFCDSISGKFKVLTDEFDIQPTHFIRTTDTNHKEAVQHIWKILQERNLIYKDVYKGWYSVVDECFYQDKDVEDSEINGQKVKMSTKTIVELIEEENYMFKLSEFKEKIRKWLENSDVIRPKHYLPIVLRYLDIEDDLSISRCRKRLPWGIPVPGDDTQTVYVWLDALVNYLTVSGYPHDSSHQWPPSCQLIGKDIIKFHAFYWPAFLLGAGLDLPKRLFVHGHWLVDNIKMSKSLGNVVDPMALKTKFTSEGVRYFLLKQGVPQDDSNFTETKALQVINSDLVNNLGNLLSRSTVLRLNSKQVYPNLDMNSMEKTIVSSADNLIQDLHTIRDTTSTFFDDLLFYKGIEGIMAVLKQANGVFQMHEPWKMKEGPALSSILFLCYETTRITSLLMQPIVPQFSHHALNRLGILNENRNLACAMWGHARPTSTYQDSQREPFVLGENTGPFMSRLK